MILFIGPFRVCSLLWFTVTYAHELICLIMSPLYRGGDIAYLSLLSSSDQFCVCAVSPSIVQAVTDGGPTLTQPWLQGVIVQSEPCTRKRTSG